MRVPVLCIVVVLLPTHFTVAQSPGKPAWPPSPHIAATDPLRPEEQLKKMKLPPGFELQLVAADPDIRKPINIAFDAKGRLWLTETIEYPYAAAEGKGRDAVKILEDFGPDGKARKITTFADRLNIPIGILPTAKGALVYSIPSIYHLIDSKNAGKADIRDILYTGFGVKDTHGMTGEFQPGFDGWVYACHGYSNASHVKSRGDTAITMQSGNTYRIQRDGSRIEQFTHGQVNPFGLTLDPLGNLYSVDCHSRPLTLLLRGAWYQSFSRPHDGLGFAPHMNEFDGHSTALCGVTYYAADQFPSAYRGRLFIGDVVRNRINAYRLEWTGCSPKAIMEDFVTSSDPWFRPVDIKLGPDGCLYFADFYNRIIGHYEVPLDHPGRDRDRGRIWRIVYRGPDGAGRSRPVRDLAGADVKMLMQTLGDPNLAVRLQAADQLVERGGTSAVAVLRPILADVARAGLGPQKVHALWVAQRLGKLDDDVLARACSASDKEVRVHAQRILTEKKTWNPKYAALAKLGLLDAEPFVKRVAIEALAAHPAADHVMPIVELRHTASASDPHLLYAVRLALREQLRPAETWKLLKPADWREKDQRAVADVCLGLPHKHAAHFLLQYLSRYDESPIRLRDYAKHIVRYGELQNVSALLLLARTKHAKNLSAQGSILQAVQQATQERGIALTKDDRVAAESIVGDLLQSSQASEQQIGAELAGSLKVVQAMPALLALIKADLAAEALRKSCIAALVTIDPQQAVPPLAGMLADEKQPIAVREQVAAALASVNHAAAHAALAQALQNAPARLQSVIALGMAGSGPGGERLLQAIEAGKASPRLLQDRAIDARLQQAKIPGIADRLKKLTQGLPPVDRKTHDLIAKRRDAFTAFRADVAAGQKVFIKHCAACHQIANQGAKIGPHLDGIGARGLDRLLEDILDPNRNVDQAFRTTVLTLKNGQIATGLFLREEGNVVILADALGKDARIDKNQIDERALSPLSPMPANFAELLSEPEMHHLLAYLLSTAKK